jgi:prephenate dehydrogenase
MEIVPRGYLRFAASGFKDTTRIASSDTAVWKDVFLSNRRSILKAIEKFQNHLSKLETKIKKKDSRGLEGVLKQAKNKRDSLEKSQIQN